MNSFIKKIIKEEKIKLVETSKEVCQAYIIKSEKSLFSSKTLLKIGNIEDATALTYYSMYYSALAILFLVGIKSENHTATIILLKELFGIDNEGIKNAKSERIDKQYYVDFKASLEDVKEGIKIAETFNSIILDKIDRISKEEIKIVRNKIKK
jgi:uncharacterized protein (UPF0332 family)